MSTVKKVLACVDRSAYATAVADAAVWVAGAIRAEVELLHVLDRHPEEGHSLDHSGTIGFDAQETLLCALAERDEVLSRRMREEGRLFLGELRERIYRADGPQVDIRLRHGELHDAVMEQAVNIDLLVLGRRGESAGAESKGLGRHVEGLVRSLSRPILSVTESFRPPRRVLMAFDGGAATRRCMKWLVDSGLLKEASLLVVMSGSPNGDENRRLAWASETLNGVTFKSEVRFAPGDPQEVIHRSIRDEEIDLLVMGAYSHSSIRALLFGSKTNELLRTANVPTLLVR